MNISRCAVENTEMYLEFRHMAVEEQRAAAVAEFDEQILGSKEHAEMFKITLDKAAKRFTALT